MVAVELSELVDFIDWTPFFSSWELYGKYPAILTDEVVGEQATSLFADAQKMLNQIVSEKWLTAKGILGIFLANTINDDDILVQPTTDNHASTAASRLARAQDPIFQSLFSERISKAPSSTAGEARVLSPIEFSEIISNFLAAFTTYIVPISLRK